MSRENKKVAQLLRKLEKLQEQNNALQLLHSWHHEREALKRELLELSDRFLLLKKHNHSVLTFDAEEAWKAALDFHQLTKPQKVEVLTALETFRESDLALSDAELGRKIIKYAQGNGLTKILFDSIKELAKQHKG